MGKSTKSKLKSELSTFFVPVSVSKRELERTLNEQIDGTVFDNDLMEDNLQIVVTKVDSIKIEVRDSLILYRVPLHIWVKKELLLGNVVANGDISLNFKTYYQLKSDWDLKVNTQLIDYEWIKEPKAQVLGFQIPVTAIAERIIKSSSDTLTDGIDQQVNENFSLESYAQMVWRILQSPMSLMEDYEAMFKFSPTDFVLTPFKSEGDLITSTLNVLGKTQVGLGKSTLSKSTDALLPLIIKEIDADSKTVINILADIPYQQMEKIAQKNLVGMVFPIGNQKLEIVAIQLTKAEEDLLIEVKTKGLYEGWLKVKGQLAYNNAENQIELQNFEFNIDTENLHLDANKWLLHGLIINKFEGGLAYKIKEDIEWVKQQVQDQITNYPIQEGIYLKGQLDHIQVNHAAVGKDALTFNLGVKGNIKIEVASLTAIN